MTLDPILQRWPLVLGASRLGTLLGIPIPILVGAFAKLLRVPADFTRTDIDPLLRRASPTLPARLLRNLREYFRPVLDRPARSLARAIAALFGTARDAPRWPVAAITGALVGLVSPLVDQAATHAENGSARLGAQVDSSSTELRGRSNRWAGWRVIGGVLFFAALWRSSVSVPDFLPAGLAGFLGGLALTSPIPLMLLAQALIAGGAIAMPWLAWILAVGALAIVMLLLALVLRAVSRALPPLAVLLGGLLRFLGIVGLVALIGVLALASAAYFAVSVLAVAVVFIAAFAGLALWAAGWLVAEAIVYALRLVARLGDAIAAVLIAIIDALMWPGRLVWNWFASFDRVRAMHIQPIRSEPRPLRLAPGEPPALEEVAR